MLYVFISLFSSLFLHAFALIDGVSADGFIERFVSGDCHFARGHASTYQSRYQNLDFDLDLDPDPDPGLDLI